VNETRNDLGSPDATLVADRNVPQLSGVAAVADHEQAAPAAQGWMIVPVEPTDEMLFALLDGGLFKYLKNAVNTRAMLAAAPLDADTAEARDAARYRWLRERDLDTIKAGGVFAGKTPANVVLNGEDLDVAIDDARALEARAATASPAATTDDHDRGTS